MTWLEVALAFPLVVMLTIIIIGVPVRREFRKLNAEAEYWARQAHELANMAGVRVVYPDQEEVQQ